MSTPRHLRADRLVSARIVAVLRARSAETVPFIAEALVAGGVTAIEITTSTPDFARAIRETCAALGKSAFVGAGTLLTESQAGAAVDAGAEFLVSPVLRPELMPVALAAETPILLGAYTPTECQAAHELGADFVKLFPADTLGPSYIRSLRAPLPHLRLVPTGGVTVDNVAEFLSAGCAAVGVGSSLLRNDWIEAGRWAELSALASRFIAAAR